MAAQEQAAAVQLCGVALEAQLPDATQRCLTLVSAGVALDRPSPAAARLVRPTKASHAVLKRAAPPRGPGLGA